MDIIATAIARRAKLLEDVAKIDAFLLMAKDLSLDGSPSEANATSAIATVKPKTERRAPTKGLVAETAAAVKRFMAVKGEGHKTRDLAPVVVNSGITLGGNSDIATLSARLSASKQFDLINGHWYIRDNPGEEAADVLSGEVSAASLFQTEGGS